MRPVFFLREALRALKRNAIPSFAAMATVLVTVLVLGVFIPVVQATTGAANEVRGKVIADVYLKTDAKQADIDRVDRLLKSEPLIGKVEFISKDQAYATEKQRNPKAYELLGSNPLPDTFRITPTNPDDIGKIRDALAPAGRRGGRTVVDPAIDEVRNREEDTNKILAVTNVVKITMALLAGLLGIASMLLIANTIRLSLYARRREVEVMKLVGATDWFIRWPFVLEGVIVGVARRRGRDPAARGGQDRGRRPARGGLRADRGAGHDRLPAADRPAAVGRRVGLRAGLRPQPAEVPTRLATSTATSSRRAPACAAARSTRAAIAAASSWAAARSSSASPPSPYWSPVVRASVTPSVNSTSDSCSPSSKVTSRSFGSGTQPSTEPGSPTGSTSPPRRITNGIGCPAQQTVARREPLSSTRHSATVQ